MSRYVQRAREISPAPSVPYAEHAAGDSYRFDRDSDYLAARLAESGR